MFTMVHTQLLGPLGLMFNGGMFVWRPTWTMNDSEGRRWGSIYQLLPFFVNSPAQFFSVSHARWYNSFYLILPNPQPIFRVHPGSTSQLYYYQGDVEIGFGWKQRSTVSQNLMIHHRLNKYPMFWQSQQYIPYPVVVDSVYTWHIYVYIYILCSIWYIIDIPLHFMKY